VRPLTHFCADGRTNADAAEIGVGCAWSRCRRWRRAPQGRPPRSSATRWPAASRKAVPARAGGRAAAQGERGRRRDRGEHPNRRSNRTQPRRSGDRPPTSPFWRRGCCEAGRARAKWRPLWVIGRRLRQIFGSRHRDALLTDPGANRVHVITVFASLRTKPPVKVPDCYGPRYRGPLHAAKMVLREQLIALLRLTGEAVKFFRALALGVYCRALRPPTYRISWSTSSPARAGVWAPADSPCRWPSRAGGVQSPRGATWCVNPASSTRAPRAASRSVSWPIRPSGPTPLPPAPRCSPARLSGCTQSCFPHLRLRPGRQSA